MTDRVGAAVKRDISIEICGGISDLKFQIRKTQNNGDEDSGTTEN